MAKYLFLANYTKEGLKGLFKDGGTKRKVDLQEALQQMGGKLETLHFAFGETDVYSIVDLPDNVSAAAASLTISASGAAGVKTVVLLTPEEIDKATQTRINYRPPGQ